MMAWRVLTVCFAVQSLPPQKIGSTSDGSICGEPTHYSRKIHGIAQRGQLALFVLDIIKSLGRVTDIRWIQKGEVFQGSYCTAQGKSNCVHAYRVRY